MGGPGVARSQLVKKEKKDFVSKYDTNFEMSSDDTSISVDISKNGTVIMKPPPTKNEQKLATRKKAMFYVQNLIKAKQYEFAARRIIEEKLMDKIDLKQICCHLIRGNYNTVHIVRELCMHSKRPKQVRDVIGALSSKKY